MDIKKNINSNKNNKVNNNNSYSSEQSQSRTVKMNKTKNMTTFETKEYNTFMGVFGVHPNNSKYTKKKKKDQKKECKTPDKRHTEIDKNDEKKVEKKKRKCVTPFKIKNLLFKGNKEKKKKDKKNLNANTENKEKIEQKEKINPEKQENDKKSENKKPEKVEKEQKLKKEKSQTENINKKPMLKRATKVYELNFYDPFNENVMLLDGEGNSYKVEFQRKDLEINILFNDNIFNSINDIHFTSDYFKFPQYLIYKVKFNPDSKNTTIMLKDYRSFKIQTKDDDFYKKVNFIPKDRIDFFKFSYLYSANQMQKKIKYPINGWEIYNPIKEFDRQKVPYGMDLFRLSQINLNYKLCNTYPSLLILPSHFDDSRLATFASCRIKNRFPVLTYVYTHPKNDTNETNEEENIQTFLYRSSQINTGSMFNKKINYEVEYINAITSIGKYNNGFVFFDCRPYFNAKANSLKGAGIDDISQYNNCKELIFGCIENIHAVRKSLKKAMEKTNYGNSTINTGKIAFNTNNNLKKFLSKFEESKWLEYLSDILIGANTVINKLLSKINVICHCSDGWDRTSQICSLVQIILDPYFRTFEGFAVLIEKDWVSFGHQFAIRNGCDHRSEKKKERSPIFIQFLHAVYQIMKQYPNAFEFRENMLLFLSDEIYSNKYGTFLFNSEKELNENEAKSITISIWSEIFLNKKQFMNPFYKYIKEPLIVKGEVQYLIIWKQFFYKYIKIGLVKEKEREEEINGINHMENLLFKQKNDIIELIKIIKNNGLENQMINNDLYKIYKDYLD